RALIDVGTDQQLEAGSTADWLSKWTGKDWSGTATTSCNGTSGTERERWNMTGFIWKDGKYKLQVMYVRPNGFETTISTWLIDPPNGPTISGASPTMTATLEGGPGNRMTATVTTAACTKTFRSD